jgi:hypothetical protein
MRLGIEESHKNHSPRIKQGREGIRFLIGLSRTVLSKSGQQNLSTYGIRTLLYGMKRSSNRDERN